jgi:long-chain acyl-CoA synthetase
MSVNNWRLIDFFKDNVNLKIFDQETQKNHLIKNILIDSLFPEEESRSLVFIYLDNSFQSLSTLLKFYNSGHVAALLNSGLKENQKVELENTYCPAFIIDSTRSEIGGYIRHNNYFKRTNLIATQIHPQLRLLLSTSGTTGSSKFVKLSEQNLMANANSIAGYLPITKDDICPLSLPLYYSYGLSVLNSNGLRGGTIVCGVRDIMSKLFWHDLQESKYTSLSGVPIYYEILKKLGFLKKDFPHLKYLTQAGGKLSNTLTEEFSKYCSQRDISFFVMYGQTEATARISYVPADRLAFKIGSIGVPIPDGELALDEISNELLYSGPNVFGGYSTQLSDLEYYDQPEYLKTGDIARVDDEGFYYITGREKRFVKLYGNRINLDELEEFLKSKFSGIELACIGINDQYLCITTTDHSIDDKLFLNFLVEEFNIQTACLRLRRLDEIPLTANGKIDYVALGKTEAIS